MPSEKKNEILFDEGMKQLEALIERLERTDLSLEDAVALYEKGNTLALQLGQTLDRQKRRIEMINPDTAEIEPFEENEHGIQ